LKDKIKHIFRSLKIVWQSSRKWSVINAFVILIKGFLPVCLIYIIKLLVDEIATSIQNNNNENLTLYITLFITGILFILNAILTSIGSLINQKHSYSINDYIQNIIHSHTTTFSYSSYENVNFQNIFHRAINESTIRPSRIYYGFIKILQNCITLLLIAGLLSSLHWFAIITLIITSLPIVILRLNYSKQLFSLKNNQTEKERIVGYYNRLLTGKEYAKELRIFNLSKLFKNQYENLKDELRNDQLNLLRRKTSHEIFLQIFASVSLFLVFGFVTKEAINGNVSQGTMVMYLLALYRGFGILQELLGNITALLDDSNFLKNLFEFIDYKHPNTKHKTNISFPKTIQKGIFIENLSFKYLNSKRKVFNNFNLNINKEETIALVGANGAGKTTLIKLLCGLYKPSSGKILIDDINLSDISNESISQNISVIFQDFMLYNTTAKENIWFGDVNKEMNEEDIKLNAEKAGIKETLEKLPQGFDTKLGTLFKDSEMLSMGEWQRMALARSFYNNAQLIILDEPTSSMDAFTEAQMIENFDKITKGRTALIVSHRLSTINLADRVVVIDNNEIAEIGSPKELMANKGVFYEMANATQRSII